MLSSSRISRNARALGDIGRRAGSIRTRSRPKGGEAIGLTVNWRDRVSLAIMIPGRIAVQSVCATKSRVPSMASSSSRRSIATPLEARYVSINRRRVLALLGTTILRGPRFGELYRREVGQGGFGAGNQNFRRAQEQPAFEAGRAGECWHDRELQLGRLDLLGERGAVALHHANDDVGMLLDEARQRRRQERTGSWSASAR